MNINKTKLDNAKKTFITAFVLGIITYGYTLVNYTPSHDGLMIVKTHQLWEMSIGRFVVWYYAPVRGLLEAPWIIGMLAVAYIACSTYLIMEILDISYETWKVFVVSAVCVMNIAFIGHAAVYYFCWDVHMLGMLFSVLAVYIAVRVEKLWGYALAALLLALSLGTYQCYFAGAIGLFILVSIRKLIGSKDSGTVLKQGVMYIITLAVSGVLYIVLAKVFQKINNIEPYSEYRFYKKLADKSVGQFFKNIIVAYKQLAQYFMIKNTYASDVFRYLNMLIILLGAALWIYVFATRVKKLTDRILLAVLLIFFPLGINCLSVLLNGKQYQLMYFSRQLVYIAMFMPALCVSGVIEIKKRRLYVSAVVTVLTAMCSFIVFRYANDLYYYQKLVGEGTNAAVTGIVYDLDRNPEFDPETMPVIMIGNISDAIGGNYEFHDIYSKAVGVTGSGTNITYGDGFEWYTKYILGRDYQFDADEDTWSRLENNPDLDEMPCYPKSGYSQVVEGCMVIKFEDQ